MVLVIEPIEVAVYSRLPLSFNVLIFFVVFVTLFNLLILTATEAALVSTLLAFIASVKVLVLIAVKEVIPILLEALAIPETLAVVFTAALLPSLSNVVYETSIVLPTRLFQFLLIFLADALSSKISPDPGLEPLTIDEVELVLVQFLRKRPLLILNQIAK